MSFVQSLSGLYGASTALDVIGNNVANSSTVGFKSSRSEFSDVFAGYLASSTSVGLGVQSTAAQQFTQGNLSSSSNMLDFSINGNGMFMVSSTNGQTTGTGANAQRVAYTRNGEFHFTPVTDTAGLQTGERYIVNANGNYLMGWADGVATTTTPSVLKVAPEMLPAATTSSTIRVNLDDRATDMSATTFDAGDPTTYNWSTSQTVYSGVADDTTPHTLSLYFVKTGVADTWTVYTRIDGNVPSEEAAGGRTMVFSPTGQLLSGSPLTSSASVDASAVTVDPVTGASTTTTSTVPLSINIDLTGSTEFATGYDAGKSIQDGYDSGSLVDLHVLDDGTIEGQFSNDKTVSLGKIALATFINPNGLQSIGDNLWVETANSGAANIGAADSGGRGVISSHSREESNTDITDQLVEMITQQRNYQANAQSIKTQDEILKTLSGLR